MKRIITIMMISFSAFYMTAPIFAQSGKPQYEIRTMRADTLLGIIKIELFPAIAPLHSAYFDSLVTINFYDSTAFHRVVPGFVIQGGDPNSKHGPRDTWGLGDSSQATIPAEFSGVSHQRGIIGAARDEDINSANSQFYINLDNNDFLDWNYTAYGQVLEGMDVVDFISLVPRDANDNPIEKIEMFITKTGFTNDTPYVPVLTYPANGEVGILALDTLKWQQVDGAVMYTLQISKTASFDSLYLEKEVGFNFYQLRELELGNVDFYWRVNANNGGNESQYSGTGHFVSSIEAPVLISPAKNDTVPVTPEFEWTAVNGATKYRLQISRSPLFQERYIVYDVDTITTTKHTSAELEGGKSHYWRVFSMTDGYQGPSSESKRFITEKVTGIKDNEKTEFNFTLLQNYPNPFNPSTTIKYTIPELYNSPSHDVANSSFLVTLKIYDVLGRNVATLVNEKQTPGTYQVVFDANSVQGTLQSGIYFYRITAGKYSQTRKMLLLK